VACWKRHKCLVTPQFWNGFSAITSLFFVVDRIFYLCLYAIFQFSWWSCDHFSAFFRGLYLPNAWSQTRHTFSLGFPSVPLVWGKTVSFRLCAGQSKRRNVVFRIWLRPRYKIPEFFTIAPVLTSILTVFRRNRGDPSSLWCVISITEKHSRSGLAWSRPRADRGLSRPTSVFRTTIGVCEILSRSVEIWQYEGQNLFWSKTELPSIGLAVNYPTLMNLILLIFNLIVSK